MQDNSLSSFMDVLIQAFYTHGKPKALRRGDVLLREGDVEKHLYYVESGLLRSFYLSEKEEQAIRFGYKGSIINSLSSFLQHTPSDFYVDALRATHIYCLTREQVTGLVHASPQNLAAYNQLLEGLVVQMIEREADLLTSNPQHRLARVMARSPQLFQEVPLRHIASYLRMTPETLSRIRKS